MSDQMIRVCLVDDDAMLLTGMQRVLRRTAPMISLTLASSAADALAALHAQPIDVLISDLRMPGMDGQSLMTAVQLQFPHVGRVIVTGALDPHRAFDLQLVTHRVMTKPVETAALVSMVHEMGPLNPPSHDPDESCNVHDVQWAESAARRLREQAARVISTEVARDNPWLAILLLQAGNAGFAPCGRPLDVQTAVRALGPEHLSIMLDRLLKLPAGGECTDSSHAMSGHTAPQLLMLRAHAREIAECMAPLYAERHAAADTVSPVLSLSDFVAVVESAALLRAASPSGLSCATSDRDLVLRTAWDADRRCVPAAIVEAVRESENESACDNVSAGAALRQAVARTNELAGHGSAL